MFCYNKSEMNKANSKKKLIIITAVIATLLAVVVCIALLLNNNKDTPTVSSTSSATEKVYTLRHDYIGDASADLALLDALRVQDIAPFTIELETTEKPYILRINFSDESFPSYKQINYEVNMESNAIILLALIKNVDEIHYSNINSTIETTERDEIVRTASDYTKQLGDLKRYSDSLERFESLISKVKQLGQSGKMCNDAEACDTTPMFLISAS